MCKNKTHTSKSLSAFGLLLVVSALMSCAHPQAYQKPLTPVQTQTVEPRQLDGAHGGARYSATIKPSSQLDLAFKAGGYLQAIHQTRGADGLTRDAQEGDWVAAGTVLARLRSADFDLKLKQTEAQLAEARSALRSSQGQLAEAEAVLDQAKRDLARATYLLESRAVTRPEYEAAKSKVEVAQAKFAVAEAQAQVIQARINGAESSRAEAALARQDAVIVAPMDCLLLRRTVEVGALIAAGAPVFTIAGMNSVKAVFGLPDLAIQTLKLGRSLPLTTEAIPGVEFHGVITRIAPVADPKSRIFEVELTIPKPPTQLRAGMIASVEVTEEKPTESALVVPLTAIARPKERQDDYAVYVVAQEDGQSVARLRPVKLGEAFGNLIAVTEGLKQGETVITVGAGLVKDGETVRVANASAPAKNLEGMRKDGRNDE